jgi:UDP-N-acetyl-D-mannosaminuronic acid transferase (WecB/TagA/CpsF family)
MSFVLNDIHLDHYSPNQLEILLHAWVTGNQQKWIVTPNPEFFLYARKHDWFKDLLNRAHLSIPDGVGLRYAIAAMGLGRLRFRKTGVDTLLQLAEICEEQEKTLVLFGAENKRAERSRNDPGAKRKTSSGRIPPFRIATSRSNRACRWAWLRKTGEIYRSIFRAITFGESSHWGRGSF